MKHFFTSFLVIFMANIYFSQCPNSLTPLTLPFVDDFESYSDTLYNNDTLICTSTYNWSFFASNINGRALCGTGSPVNNGGIGGVTFDVNGFGTFNQNDFVLTLNLSNYNSSSPIYLSFDCNNVADEPNIEDRIYIRGSSSNNWIEIYDWSILPQGQWFSERENIQISNILSNNSQSFSSTFQVKFSQYDNYGYSSDGFAIDNIEIAEVFCTKPQNATISYQNLDSIVINWDNTPGVNWNIEYGLKGFSQGQGNLITPSTSSDTITQLLPNSIYEFYIQKDCGSSSFSSWTGPLTVYTNITNDSSCNAIFTPADGTKYYTHNKNTGLQFGESFLLGNSPNNTIWFKTVVPNSGHLAIETCESNFNTELGAYTITHCSDLTTFNSLGTASFSSPSTQNICNSPGKSALELCGLTPNDTVYFWIGSYTPTIEKEITFSVYDYSLNNLTGDVILDSLNICISDTLNLYTNLQNFDPRGQWIYNDNSNAIIDDSLLLPGNLTYNSNKVNYIISNSCDADTASFSILISDDNHAGTPIENLEFCNSSTVFLLNTIQGLIETNGTWYDNSNTQVNSTSIYYPNSTSGIQHFRYIVDNNSCPADTAEINFTILDCTTINETKSNETLKVSYLDQTNISITSTKEGHVSIYDNSGKTILSNKNILTNEAYNFNFLNYSKGIYFILFNDSNSIKTKKIVIN